MAELRIEIDDTYLDDLRAKLHQNTKASTIVRDALTAYFWCAEEREKGRVILSVNPNATDPARLVMPSLEHAARTGQRAETVADAAD